MKYPIFASVVVFCLTLMYTIHRQRDKEAQKYQDFWDEENKANATRRKSLDDLKYITIPFDTLPMETLSDDSKVTEFHNTLKDISTSPIVNFTGLSATELKLQYGAANIDILDSYDQAYTVLARTLNLWAQYLYDQGYVEEAKTVLEFAMETGTDVSTSFDLLAKIYSGEGAYDKIEDLIEKASKINSILSKKIVENLEKYRFSEKILSNTDEK